MTEQFNLNSIDIREDYIKVKELHDALCRYFMIKDNSYNGMNLPEFIRKALLEVSKYYGLTPPKR